MSWGSVIVLDSELGAEIPELKIVKLFPIIRYERPWDPEPAYYRTLDEVAHLFFSVIVVKGLASAHLVK